MFLSHGGAAKAPATIWLGGSLHCLPSNPCRRVIVFFLQQSYKLVHGLDSRANRGCNTCRELVFCCLMGARGERRVGSSPIVRERMWGGFTGPLCLPRMQFTYCAYSSIGRAALPHSASILETAEGATYSFLRRKKSHNESGDWRVHAPRPACAVVASGAIFVWNLACVESKHDIEMLRGSAPRTPKS